MGFRDTILEQQLSAQRFRNRVGEIESSPTVSPVLPNQSLPPDIAVTRQFGGRAAPQRIAHNLPVVRSNTAVAGDHQTGLVINTTFGQLHEAVTHTGTASFTTGATAGDGAGYLARDIVLTTTLPQFMIGVMLGSNTTDARIRAGFSDGTFFNVSPPSAAYFSVFNGSLLANCRAAGVTTTITTGITVRQDKIQELYLEFEARNIVNFFYDGAKVATISTNVPTPEVPLVAGWWAGTDAAAAKTLYLSSIYSYSRQVQGVV